MKNSTSENSPSQTMPTVPCSRSKWRQYLVTIIVNIISFIAGTIYGWTPPILPVLQSENSPIGIPPITDDEASWLASIYCISRILFLPVYMYSIDKYGCRVTAVLTAVPFITSYALCLFANSVSMLFWARFICGIGAGGSGILVPSYTIDIAEDSIKGELNVVFGQMINIGVTVGCILGFYTSYSVFNASCLIMSVAYVILLVWLPESPLFLMTTGKTEKAKEVLQWLRNNEDVDSELERMKNRADEVLQKRKQKMSIASLTDRRMLRGLFICLGLTLNQQLSGIGAILSFAVTIFQQAGATLPPNITTILFCALQIFGTALSSIAVERWGRRFLLLSSDIVITICLFVVGVYIYLQSLGWSLATFGWVPITSLFLYMVCTGVGLGQLPYFIVTELVHPRYRSFVQTANVTMLSLSAFVTTVTFVPLMNAVGQHTCFWLYGLFCAVGSVCFYITLPETKNRSIEDVLEQMGSDRFIHSVLTYNKRTTEAAKYLSGKKKSTAKE